MPSSGVYSLMPYLSLVRPELGSIALYMFTKFPLTSGEGVGVGGRDGVNV